jgi:hypothetical protein
MRRQKNIHPLVCLTVLLLLSLSCSTLTGGREDSAQPDAGASPTATRRAADSGPVATATTKTASGPGEGAETPEEPTSERGAVGGIPECLGDYQTADGYFFAALELADPAAPSILYEEQEGMRLVGVRMIVGNQTGEQLYFSISDVAVQDAEGDVWESEYGSMDGEITSNYLDPGERVQGWLGFIIPEDRGVETLVYLYDFIDDKFAFLPLAEPPAGREPVRVDTARSPRADSPLGQAAESGGLSLVAIRVEDPGELAFPELFQPPEGMHLVSVEIEIGNIGDEAWIFTTFEVSLVDADGFLYAVDYFLGPDSIESGELEPGASFRGWVSFVVPDGAGLESIKLYSVLMDGPLYAGLSE